MLPGSTAGEKAWDFSEEEGHCVFCLDSLEDPRGAREALHCGHVFHERCLTRWRRECTVKTSVASSCPLCRRGDYRLSQTAEVLSAGPRGEDGGGEEATECDEDLLVRAAHKLQLLLSAAAAYCALRAKLDAACDEARFLSLLLRGEISVLHRRGEIDLARLLHGVALRFDAEEPSSFCRYVCTWRSEDILVAASVFTDSLGNSSDPAQLRDGFAASVPDIVAEVRAAFAELDAAGAPLFSTSPPSLTSSSPSLCLPHPRVCVLMTVTTLTAALSAFIFREMLQR